MDMLVFTWISGTLSCPLPIRMSRIISMPADLLQDQAAQAATGSFLQIPHSHPTSSQRGLHGCIHAVETEAPSTGANVSRLRSLRRFGDFYQGCELQAALLSFLFSFPVHQVSPSMAGEGAFDHKQYDQKMSEL